MTSSIVNLFNSLRLFGIGSPERLKRRYELFLSIISSDCQCHELMAELQEMASQRPPPEMNRVRAVYSKLSNRLDHLIHNFQQLHTPDRGKLKPIFKKIDNYCRYIIESYMPSSGPPFCLPLEAVSSEHLEIIGGKAQGLLGLYRLGIRIPRCVFVTTNAFWSTVEQDGLYGRIREALSEIDSQNPDSIGQVASRLLDMFDRIKVPEEVSQDIKQCVQSLGPGPYAIRSSACFEDADYSFAGQYKTILNCPPDGLLGGYLKVIASKYSANAIWYRINAGLSDEETPMGVIIMEMIDPVLSGVAYTLDPEHPQGDQLRISIVKGLGEKLVGGETDSSIELVVDKTWDGPLDPLIPEGLKRYANALNTLFHQIRRIESHLGGLPQDIEWSISRSGDLYILQTRPLKIEGEAHIASEMSDATIDIRPIFEGGELIHPGCVTGKVFIAKGVKGLTKVPFGSILVAPNALPEYSQIIGKIRGIVTEKGTVTSHLATVAREFGVPALFGAKGITQLVVNGTPVTLCATRRSVYRGGADEVCEAVMRNQGSVNTELPTVARLRALLSLVAPLTLKDPHAQNFRPEGCRSLHDLLRYCHEMSMRAMFGLTRDNLSKRYVKRLSLPVPITIYVLDIEAVERGDMDQEKGEFSLEDIPSMALRSLVRGLCHPEIDWEEREHFDWQSFDNMALTGMAPLWRDTATFSSFAVVSKNYFNLNLKFGYHFTVVDALCSVHPRSNYMSIQFGGGGGLDTGKGLRLTFIEEILNEMGFSTTVKGEELWARIMGIDEKDLVVVAERVGHLLGFTKLLDLRLTNEMRLKEAFEEFEEKFKWDNMNSHG